MLQFDKAAVEILGVQEQNRLAMSADLRLARAQHPCAAGLQMVARGQDIVHLIADVMDAAEGFFSRNPLIGLLSPKG